MKRSKLLSSLLRFHPPAHQQVSYTTSSTQLQPPLRTALFFPGHGVQRVGMASPWISSFPSTARPFLEETDSILNVSPSLSKIISEGPNEKLNATEIAQPAIMAMSMMILRILEKHFDFSLPKTVNVTLGHSLGEYSALAAAGILSYPFALRTIRRRAEVMASCTQAATEATGERYGMVALVCEPDHLSSLVSTIHEFLSHGASPESKVDSSLHAPPDAIQQITIANENSKNQIVLSGSLPRIRTLMAQVREFGGHDPRAVELNSESPFHSPIMKPAEEYMREALSEDGAVTFPGTMPVIANVTGRPFRSKEDVKDSLSRQCTQTVKWWESLKYLDQKRKVERWVGIGPGKVGRNLVGKEVGRVPTRKGGGVWSISDPKEVEGVMRDLEEEKEQEERE